MVGRTGKQGKYERNRIEGEGKKGKEEKEDARETGKYVKLREV